MVAAVPQGLRERDLPLPLYAELVNRLFSNGVSIASMGLLFAVFGGVVAFRMQDATVVVLVALGSLSSAVHLGVTIAYRRRPPVPTRQAIRTWERRYAWPGLASAVLLGFCAAKVFLSRDLESGMLMTGLVFGYASGTMARTAVRPWIGATRMALLVVWPIAALVGSGDVLLAGHGLLIAAFTIAGIETMMSLYRQAAAEIELRLTQAEKACHDPLTGLANRRALDEFLGLQTVGIEGRNRKIAVHCIDLDAFKPVNDTHGHAVGDALLCAVAQRLWGIAGAGDLLARLGGDEFVLVQTGLSTVEEARTTAQMIVRALRFPYELEGREIRTTASVGVAVGTRAHRDFRALMAEADAALYDSKSRGGNTFVLHEAASKDVTASVTPLRREVA